MSERRFKAALSGANSDSHDIRMDIKKLRQSGVIITKLSELTGTQRNRASLISPVVAVMLGRTDVDTVAEEFANAMDAEKSLLFWERFVCAASVCIERRPPWVHKEKNQIAVLSYRSTFSSELMSMPVPDATTGVDPYIVANCLTLSKEEMAQFYIMLTNGARTATLPVVIFREAWLKLSDFLKDRISAAEDATNVAIRLAKTCKKCGVPSMITKLCAGCGCVRYCSKECQTDDWKAGHKHACKRS